MNINQKIKDCIYGLAVGDALGLPYEFQERDSFKVKDMEEGGYWNQSKGTWSDDTSMTLAAFHSLKETNWKIDINSLRKHFLLWYEEDKYTANNELFDIGRTTEEALNRGEGLTHEYSNGNGSLMRISPLIFTSCSEKEIEEVSAITHAHDLSKRACSIYVQIGRELLKGKTLNEILSNNKFSYPFHRLNFINDLNRDEIKSSSYVLDSLEASIWSLINSTSYEESVIKAINLGQDTDTIGAITGALAGIIYCYENIPIKWINSLKNKEELNKIFQD